MSTELPPVGPRRNTTLPIPPPAATSRSESSQEGTQDEFTRSDKAAGVAAPQSHRFARVGRFGRNVAVGAALLGATFCALPITEGGPLDVFPSIPAQVCLGTGPQYGLREPPPLESPQELDVSRLSFDVGQLATQLHERHMKATPPQRPQLDDLPPDDRELDEGYDAPQSGLQIAAIIRALVQPAGFSALSEELQTSLLNSVGRNPTRAHDQARRDLAGALASPAFTDASASRQAQLLTRWARHQPHTSMGYAWPDNARDGLGVKFTVAKAKPPTADDLQYLKDVVFPYVAWQRHDITVHGETVRVFAKPNDDKHYSVEAFGRALSRLPPIVARHLERIILMPGGSLLTPMPDHDEAPGPDLNEPLEANPVPWNLKPPGPRPSFDGTHHFQYCLTLRAPPAIGSDLDFDAFATPDGVTLFRAPDFEGPGESGEGGNGGLETLITHEAGHHIAGRFWGWGGGEAAWRPYIEAAQKDGQSVSRYSYTSSHEDFSEHHALYVSVVGTAKEADARALYGHRFKAIDALYAEAAKNPSN